MKQLVFVFGPPGAGKTTVSRSIVESLPNACHMAAGEHWRRLSKGKSRSALALRTSLANYHPIPDSVFLRVHRLFFIKNQHCDIFVVDGNPFNVKQLELVRAAFRNAVASNFGCVGVLIDTQIDVCRERMTQRDRDGEGEDRIAQRIGVYEHQQRPVIERFLDGSCAVNGFRTVGGGDVSAVLSHLAVATLHGA